MARELTRLQLIERSINKKFRESLWNPFIAAIKRYELIAPGDRIAVCISGGKDSMLMAKLFQELLRHTDIPFEVVYLVMDPGYKEENRALLLENAQLLNVPVQVFETNIFSVTASVEKSPCYLCARMRRGNLYAKAQELGCNKIALGHHFSDVIETTLMGMLYGGQIQAMRPKLRSTNFPGMELIRPMYCIHEEDIIAWARYNDLHFLRCACRFTEQNHSCEDPGTSKRLATKLLIRQLKKEFPVVETNIFHAIHDVNMDTLVGYSLRSKEVPFLEQYRQEGELVESEDSSCDS